jgi:hypothetical protein
MASHADDDRARRAPLRALDWHARESYERSAKVLTHILHTAEGSARAAALAFECRSEVLAH